MSHQPFTELPEKAIHQFTPRRPSTTSAHFSHSRSHSRILQLQRTMGNQSVAALIQAKRLTSEGKIIGLQPKLTVGAADDEYEQEADRVARQVMSMTSSNPFQRATSPEEDKDKLQTKPLAVSITPFMQREMVNNEEPEDKEKSVQAKFLTGASGGPLQRQPETEEEETKPIRVKSAGPRIDSFEAGNDVKTRLNQSKGRGSPLPGHVRDYMEPRFGVDFSEVRVHSGSDAVQMNQDIRAQAFTNGPDIYYGNGSGPANLELTAHELTHVVQQTGGTPLQMKRPHEASSVNADPSIQRDCALCGAGKEEGKKPDPISPNIQREPEELPMEEVPEQMPEEKGGALLEVRETFEPRQPEQVPDERLEIAVVGPGLEESPPKTEEAVAAPAARFVDQGRSGTARYGEVKNGVYFRYPRAFTNGGRTGTVVWGGGGGAGAHGNQGAGSIQSQTPPNYQSKMNGATAEAWVQAGTGTINVTRSWVGINSGDQSNGHFVTAAAAARINNHETLHVVSSRSHYNTHLQPVLYRVRNYTPAPAGGNLKATAPTQPVAIAALGGIIRWVTGITDFQNADTTDNAPGGTVDTNDLNSGTYPVDAGPGMVGGKAFAHRIRTPTEPNPT